VDESVIQGGAGGHPAAWATGCAHWLTIHDDLLRGLTHAISNRLATVTASASVLEAGLVPDHRVIEGLQRDADRLEGLLQALRQLPQGLAGELEPLLLADALAGARRLVEEHPALRGRSVQVHPVGDVLPVRAEPAAVLHAAAVALLAAARCSPAVIVVTLETTGDVVRLQARGDGGTDDPVQELLHRDAEAIRWLLTTSAGHATVLPEGCAFTLPTLPASRRRSR